MSRPHIGNICIFEVNRVTIQHRGPAGLEIVFYGNEEGYPADFRFNVFEPGCKSGPGFEILQPKPVPEQEPEPASEPEERPGLAHPTSEWIA